MKKLLILHIFILSIFLTLSAQAPPEAFKYQAIVRDASGIPVASSLVWFRISIREGLETGPIIYQEEHNPTTNDFGGVSLDIGRRPPIIGDFSTIDWGSDTHYLQIEYDPGGATAYILMGISELLSVPYAMHAKTVEFDEVEDADADSTNEIQDIHLSGNDLSISDGSSVDLSTINNRNIHYATGNGPNDPIDCGFVTSRTLTFTKKEASSKLRVSYTDNIQIANPSTGGRACRWEIYVNGNQCPSQNLVYDVYAEPGANEAASRTLVGYCDLIPAGITIVSVHVCATPGSPQGDCGTGWNNQTWMLEAEEIE